MYPQNPGYDPTPLADQGSSLGPILMVIVVTIIISLFLAGVDWMIGAAVRNLLSGGA